MIEKIEGLDNNLEMHTLNLENNIVKKIENINHLKKLETLWLKSNRIGLNGKSDFENLANVKKVKVLDIQSNHIKFEDFEAFLEVLKQMDGLRCLYVQRNPFFGKVKCCKKVLINALPKLCYLNDRPVFPEDKRYA